MNISITFRHIDASDAIRAHAQEKVEKLQKFLRKPMTAAVTVSIDNLEHRAEVRVSSGSEHFEASEITEDMYMSIDRVIDKIERQIRDSKGAAQSKRRGGASIRSGDFSQPEEPR